MITYCLIRNLINELEDYFIEEKYADIVVEMLFSLAMFILFIIIDLISFPLEIVIIIILLICRKRKEK